MSALALKSVMLLGAREVAPVECLVLFVLFAKR